MNTWRGNRLTISIFGESHGKGVGCVADGLPAGIALDTQRIRRELDLRKPGSRNTSPRCEADEYEIISGVTNNKTNGSPLCVIFGNKDARSKDYNPTVPRPSHADFAAYVRYGGMCDLRGGGHFSARLTAPLVFFGAILRGELEKEGIFTAVALNSIGKIQGKSFYDVELTKELFKRLDAPEPLIDESIRPAIQAELSFARESKDSVGGTVELCMTGLPIGLGEPFFDSTESRLAQLMFSIPAVKGVEFGKGFALSEMYGSVANDEYNACAVKEKIFHVNNNAEIAHTNSAGGIIGGLTSSMPLIMRVAFKPIPSIEQNLQSIDMQSLEPAIVRTEGRHDVCAALRGAFAVRSVACICMWDLLNMHKQTV